MKGLNLLFANWSPFRVDVHALEEAEEELTGRQEVTVGPKKEQRDIKV